MAKLTFQAPNSVADALEVIAHMSMFLDFWASRQGEWHFLQILSKSCDERMWHCVAKCVVTESGKNLQDANFAALGTQGVLQALGVFCQGLLDLEIPQIYLDYCAGITPQAIVDLIKDATRIKEECAHMADGQVVLQSLLEKALGQSLGR